MFLKDKSQLLKGILEGCILKVISDNETYGYQISEKLKMNGFPEISEGTIYPLLMRLEKNGLVTTIYKESPLGPKRKYFSISPKGREELNNFFIRWVQMEKFINSLFQDYEGELN